MSFKPAKAKALVGLTGGIASGKSTAARAFASHGVAVVDADVLAREVVRKGSDAWKEIIQTFGSEYIQENGTLDRQKLGARVFSDQKAREQLNQITHPRVAALAAERFAALMHTETPYIVYEVPLLIETGMHEHMDAVVVVSAPEDVQIARIKARDGLTQEAARARLAAQLPLKKKVEAADFVICNDGTLETLQQQVTDVHRRLRARLSTN